MHDPSTWSDYISWHNLNRADHRALRRLVAKATDFHDLLDRLPVRLMHLIPMLDEAYEDWLFESQLSPSPPSDPGPTPEAVLLGARLAELEQRLTPQQRDAWLERNRLTHLADAPIHVLGRGFHEPCWTSHTLGEAIATPWGARHSQNVLAALLTAAHDEERHQHLLTSWQAPTKHEGLRELQAYCLASLRDGLLVPPTAHPITLSIDPPELVIGSVVVGLDPLSLPRARQDHLHSLLGLLADDTPEVVEQLAPLSRLLSLPPSERNLMLLTDLFDRFAPSASHELGWLLKERKNRWDVVPVTCTPRKKGGYKLRELKSSHDHPPMGAADERAWSRSTLVGALDELVDHPRVFVRQARRCDGYPRRVRRVQLQLGLRARDDETEVVLEVDGERLPPDALTGIDRVDPLWWVHPTEDAILVASIPAPIAHLQELIGRRGNLIVPDGASLLAASPWLAGRLSVDADPETLGKPVPSDDRPLLRLAFEGTTLHVEARVQPLPEAPSCVPGEGSPLQLGQRGGRSVHVRRELQEEPGRVREALAPLELPASVRPFTWRLDDPQRALDLVLRLRDHTDDLRLTWASDRPTLASRAATASDLSLRVRSGRDWFGLDGEVQIDGHVVRLQSLLSAALEGHAWVPMSDGQWLRLTDDLRKQLSAAAVASASKKGADASLRAIHAPLLQPLVDAGASLDAPPKWLSYAERCQEAATLSPEVSPALEATLRPYQDDGVRWLLRLAHWAPGACLADDMGLGKTVQTIAVLLARTDRPSLVVAPTSLLHNWQRELARFAPTLGVRLHHGTGRVLEAAPGEVLLTTYGVMVQDAAALAAHGFGTTVFDEAHALKNPSSLRSKAARQLGTDFVVALTGTPVENRVAELWSLFQVVVPGLLGSSTAFRERFVTPIELHGDTERRRSLAQLVGPFMLRRTKRQVASDLPERTEITHRVVLSDEERTLYDRARLASMARMEGAGPGKRMQILQELLRLRKLACHPKLFDATSDVPSSKLKAVRRLVSDVRESGQRMLLFSTFTSHLALIREALEADGVSIRYLDGSMSPSHRVAEVDAFQSGEGEVFLISTKAGGVGLNLTSATVVAHVDPWWNPASEDQATDRAHRIGQTRPVTVVRFVSAGTIEEQIVALHATKRELADALLAHSGSSRPVALEELVALLTEAPTETASPPPTSASASADDGVDATTLLDHYRQLLDREHQDGTIRTASTVRSYHRAVRNFLAWHQGPLDAPTVTASGSAYVEAAKADRVPHRSDKVYARPALARLARMLEDADQTP